MNNLIITDDYLDRLISDCKSEQKLFLQTNTKLDDEVQDKNNKFVSLLSDMITMSLKIKAFRKPKEENQKKKEH